MPDLEKVINTLENCREGRSCDGCSYDINSSKCIFIVHRDALALLNEQQNKIYALEVELASAKEYAEGCLELLKEQPQIVRCKDCKHGKINPYERYTTCFHVGSCLYGNTRKSDWFCADGERK